jgi:hypothetical protein
MFSCFTRFKTQLPNLSHYIEKMNNNQLTLEEILDDDDVISDLRTNVNSQFLPFFTNEQIKKLIDYTIKMPSIDSDLKIGHKYPFNAAEILCSDNLLLLDKIFGNKMENNNNEKKENKKEPEPEQNDEEEVLPEMVDVDPLTNEVDEKKEDEKQEDDKKDDDKKEEEKKEEEKKEDEKDEVKETPKSEEETKEEEEAKKKGEKKEDAKKEEEKKEDEKKEEVKKEDEKKEDEKKEDEKKEDEKKEEEKKEETKKEDEKKEETKKEDEKKEELQETPKTEEEKKESIQNEEEEKKEEDKKEESKIIYENLDYFFEFLNTESNEDNYVLIGYFYRILNHLISIRGETTVKYIYFSKPEVLNGLIRHLNRKGISEVVNKLITFENEKIPNLKEKKLEFIKQIINELIVTKDELKYEWICDLLKNSMNKKEFFFKFIEQEELIKLLYSNLDLNDSKKLKNMLNLLIKINELIISHFDKQVTPNLIPENPMDMMNFFMFNDELPDDEKNNKLPKDFDFKNCLDNFLNILIENKFSFLNDLNVFDDNEIETSYLRNQKKLGTKKLHQIEFFRTILDILVNAYAKEFFKEKIEDIIKIINEKNIFWILNEIFFKYEFNNMFQILYLQIITIAINKFSPEILINSILINSKENKNLMNILIEHSINSLKFKYESNVEVESCFFPAEIQILNDIFTCENQFVKKLIENELDLKAYNEILAIEINKIFKRKFLFSESSPDFTNDINKEENSLEMSEKTLFNLIEENIDIYNNIYKKGEDYLKILEEKKKKEMEARERKLKLQQQQENDENNLFETEENENLSNNEKFQKEKLLDINEKENIDKADAELIDNDSKKQDLIYTDYMYWDRGTGLSESEQKDILKELL